MILNTLSLCIQVPIIHTDPNICFKKTWTNYSTVSLLWFVQVFLKQTLPRCSFSLALKFKNSKYVHTKLENLQLQIVKKNS